MELVGWAWRGSAKWDDGEDGGCGLVGGGDDCVADRCGAGAGAEPDADAFDGFDAGGDCGGGESACGAGWRYDPCSRRECCGCGRGDECGDGRRGADDEWNWRGSFCDCLRGEEREALRIECERLGAGEAFDRISKEQGTQREDAEPWHSVRDCAGSGGWMVTTAFATGDEEVFGGARAGDSVRERRVSGAGVGCRLLESRRRRFEGRCKCCCDFFG